jgi:dihydrofolate synthase/folylpolyglutamate synthase
VVILEVGLGGRLDAVNILDPDVSVVTTIGRDHTAWLGETLNEIAAEKAGIFRRERPAVVGHRSPCRALLARSQDLGCDLFVLGRDFDWEGEGPGWRWTGPGLERPGLPDLLLRGAFQRDNASTALMAVSCLSPRLPVSLGHRCRGLQGARLDGRFQVLPGEVTWILDVAHNGQAAEALAANLRAYPCQGRRHAVLGVLRDKAVDEILGPLMPLFSTWDLGQAGDPRALPVADLRAAVAAALAGMGTADAVPIHAHGSIAAALGAARGRAGAGDCVVVFGSFTTVEAALRAAGLA